MTEPKVVHEWKDEKYHIQAVLENEDSGWYRLDEIHHPGDDLSGLNVTHRWGLHGSVAKELARLAGELERRKDLYESCLDSLEVEAKEHARLAARVQELEELGDADAFRDLADAHNELRDHNVELIDRNSRLRDTFGKSLNVLANERDTLRARVQELEGQIITAINGLKQYREMVWERDAENKRLREALERRNSIVRELLKHGLGGKAETLARADLKEKP